MSRTRNSKLGSSYFFISRGSRGEVSSLTATSIGLPFADDRQLRGRSDLVLADERREEIGVGGLRGFDRVAVERGDDVADLQARRLGGTAEDARDAHAGAAGQVEPFGQLARQHLHRDRHPGLARLEPGILEPGRPSSMTVSRRSPARSKATSAGHARVLAARQRLDHALERLERRRRPVVDATGSRRRRAAPAWLRRPDRRAGRRGRARRRGSRA